MPDDWSVVEVEAAVADYFDMFAKELRGERFNKAEHNRQLQAIIPSRSRGSIEKKHQNISAVLIELGYPYIAGYKPLGNYQQLLRTVVEERLLNATHLQAATQDAVSQPVVTLPLVQDILAIVVPVPRCDDEPGRIRETPRPIPRLVRRNYLEIEARNSALGSAGEEFVIRFERERLRRAGQRTLAERIEHVGRTEGDQVGYDIRSFEENGRDRLIEVKTTRFGAFTPFFASRNEVNVSETRDSDYHLYRLFAFTNDPRLFMLKGALSRTCILDPTQYAATARPES
jgi:hypothetical protein